MQDFEYNRLKHILNRVVKHYPSTSYLIHTLENQVTIIMSWCDSGFRIRKTFDATELLPLYDSTTTFYREFNLIWLSKAGERI